MAKPVEHLAPSVKHVGGSLAHAVCVRQLTGAAADSPKDSLMERDALSGCQCLQQGTVLVVKPQIHGHDAHGTKVVPQRVWTDAPELPLIGTFVL